MDRTTKEIEQVISEIYELIATWKQSKPSQQEILHPSCVDSFGNKYPNNPLKEQINKAYNLLQKYRHAMSAAPAIDIDHVTAYMEVLGLKQQATKNLLEFHRIAKLYKAEKVSKK